jgi:sugar phosphate isomerase/epimerase
MQETAEKGRRVMSRKHWLFKVAVLSLGVMNDPLRPAEQFQAKATRVSRRQFLGKSVLAGAGLMTALPGCSSLPPKTSGSARVAFVTANLVARFSDYKFELAHWGEQHKKTIAATDAAAWRSICREISATGFRAVEIWEAHAAPEAMNRERGATWKAILDEHGLKAIGYGGGLSRQTLQICQWLDIPQINGWIGENTPEQATALCREMDVRFNVENHPQKNADELLKVVGGGDEWLGVCIDTGWFGTQGVSAPEVIRACGRLVRHTHIKDVTAAGAHQTCLLGEGVAQVAGCIAMLMETGYSGWYSWEDEPEDRNPFDSAVRNRQWIEQRLAQTI